MILYEELSSICFKFYHLLPQLLHFQVLPKSPAPNIPNNPTFVALPIFEILDKYVDPQVGHFDNKENIIKGATEVAPEKECTLLLKGCEFLKLKKFTLRRTYYGF